MTALLKLRMTVDGEDFAITCNGAAPRTFAALGRILPQPLQLHTPKIAGAHIYWHAPLVEDVEDGIDVLAAPPGAFIYWPVRQFLEITYAPLQAETASVTVLGQLDAPVERVAALAARLREGQGRRVFAGELARVAGAAPAPAPVLALPAGLLADCAALWRDCPDEIWNLRRSRALMHPAGPIFTAESEARTLHELMWRLRTDSAGMAEDVTRRLIATVLDRTAGRLRDFCHLKLVPDLLFRLSAAMGDKALPLADLLVLSITTSGRIAAWFDLLIPWNDINQAFRAALDAPLGMAAHG